MALRSKGKLSGAANLRVRIEPANRFGDTNRYWRFDRSNEDVDVINRHAFASDSRAGTVR
jgi:hypothetical protein